MRRENKIRAAMIIWIAVWMVLALVSIKISEWRMVTFPVFWVSSVVGPAISWLMYLDGV